MEYQAVASITQSPQKKIDPYGLLYFIYLFSHLYNIVTDIPTCTEEVVTTFKNVSTNQKIIIFGIYANFICYTA